VRLLGVSKRYRVRGDWVLRDIDAELAPRQLIRLTGPNGCGKSTLLRLVCGASAPSRGRITARPPLGQAGYVPERFPPELPFTAQEYLTHLGRVRGLRGARLDGAVIASIERLSLGQYASRPLRELSKGNCQKVAVAQALLGEPELLGLDEAWTGLDAETRAVLDQMVEQRVAAGATVLFVDHDPARLAGRASTQWALSDGQLIESLATNEIRASHQADVTTPTGPLQSIVIEFSGLRSELGALRGLRGVVSAEVADGVGRVIVSAGRSDDVLRWLLSVGGAHIDRVGQR